MKCIWSDLKLLRLEVSKCDLCFGHIALVALELLNVCILAASLHTCAPHQRLPVPLITTHVSNIWGLQFPVLCVCVCWLTNLSDCKSIFPSHSMCVFM